MMRMASRSKSRGYRDGFADTREEKGLEAPSTTRNQEPVDEGDAQDLLREKNKRQKLAEMLKEQSL